MKTRSHHREENSDADASSENINQVIMDNSRPTSNCNYTDNYNHDYDDYEYNDREKNKSLLKRLLKKPLTKLQKKYIFENATRGQMNKRFQSIPAVILQRRQVTLRSLLLALSLTIILHVFWLLDSLKDATFAVLVNGNLQKHQPLAKMASVCGTLILVVFMEIISSKSTTHPKRKCTYSKYSSSNSDEYQHHHAADTHTDAQHTNDNDDDDNNSNNTDSYQNRIDDMDHILNPGGTWTKMGISSGLETFSYESHIQYTTTSALDYTSQQQQQQNQQQQQQYSETRHTHQIPVSAFQYVGVSYVIAFATISYLLTLDPDFQQSVSSLESGHASAKKSLSWNVLGYFQYLLIESYGSISVATFWSFVNSTLTLKAAKTYYGFIIAMAQLGAISGSTIATFKKVTVPQLFAFSCFGILVQMALMIFYHYLFPNAMSPADDAALFLNDASADDNNDYESELETKAQFARQKRKLLLSSKQLERNPHRPIVNTTNDGMPDSKIFMSGVHLILKYHYLLLILGVSCLYEISLTCLDYEMKLIGLDRFSASSDSSYETTINTTTSTGTVDNSSSSVIFSSFATFMGRYGQVTNFLSLILSYYAFPFLLDRYGLSHTLRIFPTLLLIVTLMAFIALPMNLTVLFISMSLLKAMTYSLNDPAKEILYIPTSDVVKFKAKFWIDAVGARIAKAIGSTINTYAGSAERIVQYGSIPSVLTAMALWIVCYAVGMEFDTLLENGDIVGIEEDEMMEEFYEPLTTYDEKVSNSRRFNHSLDGDLSSDDDDDDCISFEGDSGWESNATIELMDSNRRT